MAAPVHSTEDETQSLTSDWTLVDPDSDQSSFTSSENTSSTPSSFVDLAAVDSTGQIGDDADETIVDAPVERETDGAVVDSDPDLVRIDEDTDDHLDDWVTGAEVAEARRMSQQASNQNWACFDLEDNDTSSECSVVDSEDGRPASSISDGDQRAENVSSDDELTAPTPEELPADYPQGYRSFTRAYVHTPNKNVNHWLTTALFVVVAIVTGLAVGHFFGSERTSFQMPVPLVRQGSSVDQQVIPERTATSAILSDIQKDQTEILKQLQQMIQQQSELKQRISGLEDENRDLRLRLLESRKRCTRILHRSSNVDTPSLVALNFSDESPDGVAATLLASTKMESEALTEDRVNLSQLPLSRTNSFYSLKIAPDARTPPTQTAMPLLTTPLQEATFVNPPTIDKAVISPTFPGSKNVEFDSVVEFVTVEDDSLIEAKQASMDFAEFAAFNSYHLNLAPSLRKFSAPVETDRHSPTFSSDVEVEFVTTPTPNGVSNDAEDEIMPEPLSFSTEAAGRRYLAPPPQKPTVSDTTMFDPSEDVPAVFRDADIVFESPVDFVMVEDVIIPKKQANMRKKHQLSIEEPIMPVTVVFETKKGDTNESFDQKKTPGTRKTKESKVKAKRDNDPVTYIKEEIRRDKVKISENRKKNEQAKAQGKEQSRWENTSSEDGGKEKKFKPDKKDKHGGKKEKRDDLKEQYCYTMRNKYGKPEEEKSHCKYFWDYLPPFLRKHFGKTAKLERVIRGIGCDIIRSNVFQRVIKEVPKKFRTSSEWWNCQWQWWQNFARNKNEGSYGDCANYLTSWQYTYKAEPRSSKDECSSNNNFRMDQNLYRQEAQKNQKYTQTSDHSDWYLRRASDREQYRSLSRSAERKRDANNTWWFFERAKDREDRRVRALRSAGYDTRNMFTRRRDTSFGLPGDPIYEFLKMRTSWPGSHYHP